MTILIKFIIIQETSPTTFYWVTSSQFRRLQRQPYAVILVRSVRFHVHLNKKPGQNYPCTDQFHYWEALEWDTVRHSLESGKTEEREMVFSSWDASVNVWSKNNTALPILLWLHQIIRPGATSQVTGLRGECWNPAAQRKLVVHLYWQHIAAVKTTSGYSNRVPIIGGVRQGCILSKAVLNLYS